MRWWSYLICCVLIVVGAFCGLQLYKEVKAESYVNGSIDISNRFSQESFVYKSTSAVFYHDLYDDTDTYSFETDLPKTENFDGERKTYKVTLNDFVLFNAEINAGSVYADVYIDFYNTDGNVVNNALMNLSVKFLSGKTKLTLSTKGTASARFLEQYFNDNGLRLQIIEIKEEIEL